MLRNHSSTSQNRVCSSVFMSTITGMAAAFSPKYINQVMIGNGLSGLTVGILRVLTKILIPKDVYKSTLIYFCIGAFVILLNIGGYLLLKRLPFAIYHLRKLSRSHSTLYKAEEQESESLIYSKSSRLQVFKQLWSEAVTVMFIFFVTFSIYPGVSSLIQVRGITGLPQGWYEILLINTLQLFDFTGRTLPKLGALFSKTTLWIPSLSRSLFMLLFVFCVKPLLITDFYWPIIFMVIFAVTNGSNCSTFANFF